MDSSMPESPLVNRICDRLSQLDFVIGDPAEDRFDLAGFDDALNVDQIDFRRDDDGIIRPFNAGKFTKDGKQHGISQIEGLTRMGAIPPVFDSGNSMEKRSIHAPDLTDRDRLRKHLLGELVLEGVRAHCERKEHERMLEDPFHPLQPPSPHLSDRVATYNQKVERRALRLGFDVVRPIDAGKIAEMADTQEIEDLIYNSNLTLEPFMERDPEQEKQRKASIINCTYETLANHGLAPALEDKWPEEAGVGAFIQKAARTLQGYDDTAQKHEFIVVAQDLLRCRLRDVLLEPEPEMDFEAPTMS